MFNETSYTLGETPQWQQKGYPDKASCKAALGPGECGLLPSSGGTSTGGGFTPPPGAPTVGPGGTTGPQVPIDGAPQPGEAPPEGGGGLLSGIPTTYLLIGAVIIGLMVFKK